VRITATTRLGEGEVVDIERETEMGGPIHSKGVMILSSFLMARYAKDHPVSVAASLVFEQSYSGIEGDSASLAELSALLSSISGVPIRQCLAITGSVNQHGQAQPIGGVNEKIEGFFDVCRRRGLDGSHGVIIPRSNADDLMLRADVVAAVREQKFSVHAVSSADEAIELLTGMAAGERGADGAFPADSVNGRVDAALNAMAELRREHAHPADTDDHGEKQDAEP
jgi:predicted ATP-dependent protease